MPDRPAGRVTIFIRNGTYEEIVYFRNKTDITFLGESRRGVVIRYANNERFNGPPPGVATNEKPGTFPYRRAVFMADRSSGIDLVNLTIVNDTPAGGGQAEALLLSGGRNIVSHVTLESHQDTFQLNDAAYVEDSAIEGDTDFLWGRGPAFFTRCDATELSNGSFMWVRSTAASHGFVFDRCTFTVSPGAAAPAPFLARNTAAYPDSEVVLLDCALGLVNPALWSLPADPAHMRYWEYRSVSARDHTTLDLGARHPSSRQLEGGRDDDTVAQYRDPAFVLGGWSPSLRPIVLDAPARVDVRTGGRAAIGVSVAAIPAPVYEWRHDGTVLRNGPDVHADAATLVIDHVRARDAGLFTLVATNASGVVNSAPIRLAVR